MARLTASARRNIPSAKFGLPGKRAYPMPDKTHARVAKSYAARYASPSQRGQIDAKANKVLGKSANAFNKARKVLTASRGK